MRSEFSQSAHSLLTHSLAYHLEDVEYLGLVATGHARKNKKHPEHAELTILFPDPWLVNALGEENFVDTYFIVKIDRTAVDEWSGKVRALRAKREAETQDSPENTDQLSSSPEDNTPAPTGHSSTLSTEEVSNG
jgi:hypothetical protein